MSPKIILHNSANPNPTEQVYVPSFINNNLLSLKPRPLLQSRFMHDLCNTQII